MKKSVTLRLPDHLDLLVSLKARRDRIAKATALRHILYAGAEAYTLQLLSQGEVSLSRAGELLDLNPWEVLERAAARGIEVGGTSAQHHSGEPSRVAEGPPGREVQWGKDAKAAHRIRRTRRHRER